MDLMFLTPVGAVLAILFAVMMAARVLKFSEGSDKMAGIAMNIRKGANAYLKRQYMIVGIFLPPCS